MNKSLEWYRMVFDIVQNTELILAMLLMGVCFAVMVKPYLRIKRTIVLCGTSVAVGGTLLYLITESGGVYIYSFVMLATFLLMYFSEKEKPLQKAFLCVLFLSLRYLSNAILAEWGFFSLWLDLNMNIPASADVDTILLDFILGQILSLILHIFILYLMVRLFTRIYKGSEELSIWEFLLLLIPAIAPLFEAAIFKEYIRIYNQGLEDGFIKENIPPNFGRFLFYVCSYSAILLVAFLYEQVRKERDENAQSEALKKELSGMRQTIEQTRHLYDQIRTLRHYISNHLMTMERLSDHGNTTETKEYMLRLKEEYSESIDGIRCGDPVIDVVLTGKRDAAVQKGIDFRCDFVYPKQPRLDAFDLSVLLNNALDNAICGASGDKKWISITSSSLEQFFTIVIRNSFDGTELTLDADGLPLSTKSGEGHGLGLKLIRRIALSYHGDMEFVRHDNEVELRILLHNKENTAE